MLIAISISAPLAGQRIGNAVPAFPASQNKISSKLTQPFPTELVKMYDTIRLVFIGDVMQHGNQIRSALIKEQDPNLPTSYDHSYAFKYVEPFFRQADVAAANMEFPTGGPPYKGYPLFSAPESIVWQARKSGINLFLLANNHLLDMGKEGLEKTLRTYKQLGEKYIGAYASEEEEKQMNPVIFQLKETRIAILNFTYGTNGFPVPAPYQMNLMDSTHVKEVIQRAKARGAELIIAAPHWGEEYQLTPSPTQRKWAEMLFREGVKIIIGSHPHVPQTAEIYYKNNSLPPLKEGGTTLIGNKEVEKFIFYSLGNYISNQSIPDYSQLELLVNITLVKDRFSEKIIILAPEYKFLWCFKKNEFQDDYTVIPVEALLGKEELVRNPEQYRRMVRTYNYIKDKKLIKHIY